MAKTFKKSSTKKTGWKKTRTSGRVTKKSNAKTGTSTAKFKALVAQEVRNELRSGDHGEKRKVTMELTMKTREIYVNGKMALVNSVRIPITDALPAQAGGGQNPDDRRRGSNKVKVTGVNVRASFAVSDETRLMMFAYEPHASVQQHLDSVPVQTIPSAKGNEVPEQFATHMVPFQNLGIVSKHGPLMVKKAGTAVVLDSVDGSPYESRVAKHPGRPIGAVFRKTFNGGGGLKRTLNWDQSQYKTMGLGWTQWTTHRVNEMFPINKTYTYLYETFNDQQFERSAEMLLVVDCPTEGADEMPLEVVGAKFRNVVVDIYYHDVPK